MPRRKRFSRRSRPRRRRRRMRRTRRVILDPEQKRLDNGAAFTVGQVGVANLLNVCDQGTGTGSRIGSQIIMTSIQVSYTLTVNPNATPSSVRLALVYFKQPQGAAMDLNAYWTQLGTAIAPLSYRNIGNGPQFKTLWTRNHSLGLGNQTLFRRSYKKVKLRVKFTGTGGGIGDIATGSVFMVSCSDAAAANTPLFSFTSRIRFVG